MAKKVLLLKLLQEIRGYQNITNRRPTPATPLLYLMQLRQRNALAPLQPRTPKPRQRLAITTQWSNPGDVASPIKIHHEGDGRCDLPIVIL